MIRGIDATVAGTDVDGAMLYQITIDGGNAGAVVTSGFFATIAGIHMQLAIPQET